MNISKKWLLIGAPIGLILGTISPLLLIGLLYDRPDVDEDWLKARSFEYLNSLNGEAKLVWEPAGENCWYFPSKNFGIRYFPTNNDDFLLVFAPNGDGPQAYIYRSDGKLLRFRDDALSVSCDWNKIRKVKNFHFVHRHWKIIWPRKK